MNLSGPIALVTATVARNLDDDMPPLVAALNQAGASIEVVDWDDPAVKWDQYRIVVLRSTWDYSTRMSQFLAWADRVSAQTQLINPVGVVHWNTDKHYLAFLIGAGVATIPSVFIEPGQDAQPVIDEFLQGHATLEVVVKPAIGAGARDVQRYSRHQREEILAHTRRLLADKRSVLLQPYMSRIDEAGETALIYIAGKFSHAIRKGPILKRDAPSVQGLFAAEVIAPRQATADEIRLADSALAAVPFDELHYARVDLVRDAANDPCVLEVELTEPSLFFAHGAGAAEKFAAMIMSIRAGDRNRPARD